ILRRSGPTPPGDTVKRGSDARRCPGLPGPAITVRAAYRIEPHTKPLLREGVGHVPEAIARLLRTAGSRGGTSSVSQPLDTSGMSGSTLAVANGGPEVLVEVTVQSR